MSAEIKPWQTEGLEKRQAVQRLFSDIAPTYDRFNSIISLRLHRSWRRAAVRTIGLHPGERVLDLCCGTGDFLHPILDAVGSTGAAVGIDFCRPMLEIAATKTGSRAGLAVGDACAIPLASESVDAVTVGWGLRNVPDLALTLRESVRVLRAGGRFVSLDMARPRLPIVGRVADWMFHRMAPLLGIALGNREAYTYLPRSADRFLSREQLAEEMAGAGLKDVRHRDFFFGTICMHWGRKP